MRFLPLLLVVLFAVSEPLYAACGACADNSDCLDDSCRWCNTGIGTCQDCCQFEEEVLCPTGCTWNVGNGECRNNSSIACTVTVPELPNSSMRAITLVVVVGGVVVFSYLARRAAGPPA